MTEPNPNCPKCGGDGEYPEGTGHGSPEGGEDWRLVECELCFPIIEGNPVVLMREYRHPNWDMTLFTEDRDGDRIALDILGEGTRDPALLTFTVREMTREEINALPEFDG